MLHYSSIPGPRDSKHSSLIVNDARVLGSAFQKTVSGTSIRNSTYPTKTSESFTQSHQWRELAPSGVRHLETDKAHKECFFSPGEINVDVNTLVLFKGECTL